MQVETTEAFDAWLDSLKDHMTRIRLSRRLDKAMRGLLGDVQPVGEGVFEMREFFGAGWRMYYIQRGPVLRIQRHANAALYGETHAIQQERLAHVIEYSDRHAFRHHGVGAMQINHKLIAAEAEQGISPP